MTKKALKLTQIITLALAAILIISFFAGTERFVGGQSHN
jgi:hypothetical protein